MPWNGRKTGEINQLAVLERKRGEQRANKNHPTAPVCLVCVRVAITPLISRVGENDPSPPTLWTGTVAIVLEQLLEKIPDSLLINPKHTDVIVSVPYI
jgi:hypothetical protein